MQIAPSILIKSFSWQRFDIFLIIIPMKEDHLCGQSPFSGKNLFK